MDMDNTSLIILATVLILRRRRRITRHGYRRILKAFLRRLTGTNEPQDDSSSNEVLDSDSSSSDESDRGNPQTSTSALNKKSKSKNKKPQFNTTVVSGLITQLINLDMNESLTWLAECLTEAAEDLEQDIDLDNDDGVPIVAISEDSVLALDHSVFKKLMAAIGLLKPETEQESYWRIPVNIPAAELTRIASMITRIMENGGVVQEPVTTTISSDDEDVFDKVRKFVKRTDDSDPFVIEPNIANEKEANMGEPAETEVTFEEVDLTEKLNTTQKTRIQIQDADKSETEVTFEEIDLTEKSSNTRKTRVQIEDSDESDDDKSEKVVSQTEKNNKGKSEPLSVNRKNKGRFLNDSDNESERGPSQISIVSDEVENSNDPPNKKNKSRILGVSDSEEETEIISQNSGKMDDEDTSVNKKNIRRFLDESDDESEKSLSQINTVSDKEDTVNDSSKGKNKSRVLDDSDSDLEETISQNTISQKSNPKEILEDSDDSKIANPSKDEIESTTKRNREDESESERSIKRKKIAIIDSDDE